MHVEHACDASGKVIVVVPNDGETLVVGGMASEQMWHMSRNVAFGSMTTMIRWKGQSPRLHRLWERRLAYLGGL